MSESLFSDGNDLQVDFPSFALHSLAVHPCFITLLRHDTSLGLDGFFNSGRVGEAAVTVGGTTRAVPGRGGLHAGSNDQQGRSTQGRVQGRAR